MSGESQKPEPTGRPAGAGGSGRQRRMRTDYKSDGAASKRGFQFIVLPVIILVVLGLVGSVVAKPAYQKYRESRGRAAAIKSAAEFAAGDIAASMRSLRLSMQLAPADSTVMRNAANILATEDVPEALNFYQKVIQSGDATVEDRLRYVGLAIRLRRFGIAKTEADALLKIEPNNILAWRMMIELHEYTGNPVEAIAAARKLVELEGSDVNRYHLGHSLVKASMPVGGSGRVSQEQVKWAEEGAGILLPMAVKPGELQSLAASALADTVRLEGDAARQVIEALSQRKDKSVADVLSMAVIQIKADPSKAEESTKTILREVSKSDLTQRIRAAGTLAGLGAPQIAAQLITPADTQTNAVAAYMEVDLAIQNKNWARIKQTLGQSNLFFAGTMTNVMMAAVAVGDNKPTEAESILRTAIDEADRSVRAEMELSYLARTAEQMGLGRTALVAHEARLRRGQAVMDASDQIVRLAILEQARDPQFPGLLRQYPALHARYTAVPDDLSTASQYYYVSAVLGRDLPGIQTGIAALRKRLPDRPEPIVCQALAALKAGAKAEATRILEESPIDAAALPLRFRPAMVHLLGNVGQKEQARILAQKIDLAQCFLEEREMVLPWLQQ